MPKKLYRVENDKIIAGVCGGIGEYINLDANIVRLLFVLFGIPGPGIIVYIIAAILLPTKSQTF